MSNKEKCIWESVGLEFNETNWQICPNSTINEGCFCSNENKVCGEKSYIKLFCISLNAINPTRIIQEVSNKFLLLILFKNNIKMCT